jgi:hypothetical protein
VEGPLDTSSKPQMLAQFYTEKCLKKARRLTGNLPLSLPLGGDEWGLIMHDSAWTIQNVNDLTRRSFELLATQRGFKHAEFLELLVVEYAIDKVLCARPERLEPVSTKALCQEEGEPPSSKRTRLKPVEDQKENESPSCEEIKQWMRRLDAKKGVNPRGRRRSAFGFGFLQAVCT